MLRRADRYRATNRLLNHPPVEHPSRSPVLAFGGGGARGIAHLGVLQHLEQVGWKASRMVGVSIGSLVAAMCATDSLPRALTVSKTFLASDAFRQRGHLLPAASRSNAVEEWSFLTIFHRMKRMIHDGRRMSRLLNHPSLLPAGILTEAIEAMVPDIDISETNIPIKIIAADLISGHPVVLRAGSLRTAVQASASIPGIFPPVEFEDKLLCDIGGIDSLPSQAARERVDDFIIAVDVGPNTARDQDYDRAIDVLMRMEEIAERASRHQAYELADMVIRPHVGDCAWYDFDRYDELVEAGQVAAKRALHAFAASAS